MFRFLVTNELGVYNVQIESDDYFEAGPWVFIDDIPDLFKESFISHLKLNGVTPLGQAIDTIDLLTPAEFEATWQKLDSTILMYLGERLPMPEHPSDTLA